MQEFKLSVLVVDRNDYDTFIASKWGLSEDVLSKYDLIIDKESQRIIFFDVEHRP